MRARARGGFWRGARDVCALHVHVTSARGGWRRGAGAFGEIGVWGGRGVGRVALRVWGERVGAAWRRVRAGGASRERRERRGGCCESGLHSN